MKTLTIADFVYSLLRETTASRKPIITFAFKGIGKVSHLLTSPLYYVFNNIPGYILVNITASSIYTLTTQLEGIASNNYFKIVVISLHADEPKRLSELIDASTKYCQTHDITCIFLARLKHEHSEDEDLNLTDVADTNEFGRSSDAVFVPNEDSSSLIVLKNRMDMFNSRITLL